MGYTRIQLSSTGKECTATYLGFFIAITFVATYEGNDGMKQTLRQITQEQARKTHLAVVTEFMKDRENWNTSNLGSWLFKYNKYVLPQNRTFLVYYDKGLLLSKDSLTGCSVTNCRFTSDRHTMPGADAIVVWVYRRRAPRLDQRNPKQIWIFWNDEAPRNPMLFGGRKVHPRDIADIFNWSMTYRTDADIPVTYGRTMPLDEPVLKIFDTSALTEIIPNWKRKRRDVLVATMMSNCMKFRKIFIPRLQSHIPIDVYGKCSNNDTLKHICPGHYNKDCDATSEYLFYLAIENSDCRDYITEKVWYSSYTKGAIPIIVEPSLSDCKRLLPPNSFLHMTSNNKAEIEKIAKHIVEISENDDLLLSFHRWRNHFITINDHGYFGGNSCRLCRLCEGLNYNDYGMKVYSENDIRIISDTNIACGANNV